MFVFDDGDHDPIRRWRNRLKEIKEAGRTRERAAQKQRDARDEMNRLQAEAKAQEARLAAAVQEIYAEQAEEERQLRETLKSGRYLTRDVKV
jgi:predicted  nucleic acid-binding Zn-ribbon protein